MGKSLSYATACREDEFHIERSSGEGKLSENLIRSLLQVLVDNGKIPSNLLSGSVKANKKFNFELKPAERGTKVRISGTLITLVVGVTLKLDKSFSVNAVIFSEVDVQNGRRIRRR